MTYNSQDRNEIFIDIPQQPTLKITKSSIFYHNSRHVLKNKKNAHIMVNDTLSPIPQLEGKKKHHTDRDIKR